LFRWTSAKFFPANPAGHIDCLTIRATSLPNWFPHKGWQRR